MIAEISCEITTYFCSCFQKNLLIKFSIYHVTVICFSSLYLKDPSTFVEIMKMIEILIVQVITKHFSLSYLGWSIDSCDNKTKLTRDRSSCLEVFWKKSIFKVLRIQNEIQIHRKPPVPKSVFRKFVGLQITTLLKEAPAYVFFCEILRAPILQNTFGLLLLY